MLQLISCPKCPKTFLSCLRPSPAFILSSDVSVLLFCSSMDEWVGECLGRRAAGGLLVRGKDGSEHLLAGSKRERRHFFGLCPVCLNIGEHSACSGSHLPIVRFRSSLTSVLPSWAVRILSDHDLVVNDNGCKLSTQVAFSSPTALVSVRKQTGHSIRPCVR